MFIKLISFTNFSQSLYTNSEMKKNYQEVYFNFTIFLIREIV